MKTKDGHVSPAIRGDLLVIWESLNDLLDQSFTLIPYWDIF